MSPETIAIFTLGCIVAICGAGVMLIMWVRKLEEQLDNLRRTTDVHVRQLNHRCRKLEVDLEVLKKTVIRMPPGVYINGNHPGQPKHYDPPAVGGDTDGR